MSTMRDVRCRAHDAPLRRFAGMTALLAAFVLSFAAGGASAAYDGPEMTLRFATIKSKTISQGKQWNHFAERVADIFARLETLIGGGSGGCNRCAQANSGR